MKITKDAKEFLVKFGLFITFLLSLSFLVNKAWIPQKEDKVLTWMQSENYSRLTNQIYQGALERLDGIEGGSIVLDIDETVLFNLGFQLSLNGKPYTSEAFDSWIKEASAPLVPGALDFINTVKSRGFDVYFVTNRKCWQRETPDLCPQEADTILNLMGVGVIVSADNILLRGERQEWGRDKKSRMQSIENVVMSIGDQLGDTGEGVGILLPNPIYGSWLK